MSDADRLRQAANHIDTVRSALVVVDPSMGVIVSEQIKTLFLVVAQSPAHGAANWPCDCLVCAAVHNLADVILGDSDV